LKIQGTKNKFHELRRTFIIQNFSKELGNNLLDKKNSTAPIGAICGRLSHHQGHKLPFCMV
jgi:hypothetical protein